VAQLLALLAHYGQIWLQARRGQAQTEEIGTVEEAAFGQWGQGVALGVYVN